MPKNTPFTFGLVSGIAIISSAAAIILLVYVFMGGSFARGNNGDNKDNAQEAEAKQFTECLSSGKYDTKIGNDQQLGIQLGVRGTPAAFINGYLIAGAYPIDSVSQVIDAILAGKEPDMDFLKDEESGEIKKVEMPQITSDDHQTGAANGKITMLLFSDFECPYCSRFEATVKQVMQKYPNDVTVVFKHFPLSFHQNAKPAAVASECANEQGKFWEMHNKLFELSAASGLNEDAIKKAGIDLGLK